MPPSQDELKFNEQAFLLDFFTQTVRGNVDRAKTKTQGKVVVQSYPNFVQMSGDSAALMNRLQAAGNTNILWSLSTAQLGMLVPKIGIAKVIKGGNGKLTTRQFHFDDYTSVKSIKASSRERGADVGLVSFTWNDMGTNPGDSGLSFEAEMKLKFQSFDGVFKNRDGISFADLLVPSNPADISGPQRTLDESEFQIKVIVGWAIPSDPKGAVFKDKKLMAAIGQTQVALLLTLTSHDVDIKEDGSVDLTIKYIAALEGRMMTPKMDLFQMNDDDFEKNFAIKTSILNRARRGKADASSNISKWEREKKKNLAIIREKGFVKIQHKTFRSEAEYLARFAENAGGGGASRDKLVGLKKDYKEARKSLKQLKYQHKLQQYQRFLGYIEGIIYKKDGKVAGIDPKRRRIFFIELNQTQIETYSDMCGATFPDEGGASAAERGEKRRQAIRKHRSDSKFIILKASEGKLNINETKGATERHSATTDLVKELLASSKEGEDDPSSVHDSFVKTHAGNTSALELDIDDLYYLNYFYFGDLVNAALQSLKDDPATKEIESDFQLPGGDFGFMMGMINLYDPDAGTDGEMVSVPLADIPISLRVFQSWFLDSVIKKGVSRMPLLSFLKQVCSKLITGALNPKMFGSPQKAPNTRISMSSMVIRANAFDSQTSFISPTGGRIKAEDIGVKRKGKIKPPPSWAVIPIEGMRQFYFLYVGGNLNDRLRGNKTVDEEMGIYHLYLGKDSGLIKKVNFKRTDIPFQREARIMGATNNDKAGPASSNLLFSDHYNASISMLGNALFKPGMLLFINPTAMGLDPPAVDAANIAGSTSSKIGIGGYYLVIKVENILESGKFETNLELVAQAPMYALPSVRTSTKAPGNKVDTTPTSNYKSLDEATDEQATARGKKAWFAKPKEATK